MHLAFAVRINHTQNYDARLMANKSGANSRKHWRHRRLSCCEICMQNAKGVPTNQLSLVQLNSCSWSCSFSFSFCIILSVPVFSCIRHIPSCHLLSSISSGFTVTISVSVSVSVTGNLLGCPTMRWSGCLAVWQSDNLTVLAAWLLGFRATQAASLCAPVAACNLQLPAHTNLPLSNLLATAAAATLAVVVAPKCTLLFFKSQQADDNNTSWN